MAPVTVEHDIAYVDDSKATNPPAAAASFRACDTVVWIAGGLLKGADVSDLVKENTDRLRGAVLLGKDRSVIAKALQRFAPQVPVVLVEESDGQQAMSKAVAAARDLAQAGDTVLLAPAAASLDMFSSYAARGDAFAHAVLGEDGQPS